MLIEIVVRDVIHPVPDDEVPLERRPAEVEVSVLQAQVFPGFDLVVDRERRGLGLVQDHEARRHHVHIPRLQIGVCRSLGSELHPPRHADDILAPQPTRHIVRIRIVLRIEDHLCLAIPVSEVDKNHAPQIPAGVHPAVQCHGFADVGAP